MSNHSIQSGERSHERSSYWKRAHRDWRFWVAVLFIAVALVVYVMSDDLALVPRMQPRQSAPVTTSK